MDSFIVLAQRYTSGCLTLCLCVHHCRPGSCDV